MSRIDIQLVKASKTPSIMGSGFIALDIVYGHDGLFAATGGSCGNVIIALAWLGWNSVPVARLGCDESGDFLISDLKKAGVSLELIERSEAIRTPVVIQQFLEDANGSRRHRFSLVCPECGAWLPRYRNVVLAQAQQAMKGRAPKAFYFDRISPAVIAMAEWAKKDGAVVMFEPSSIGEDSLFERAVDACDILKFSNERLSKDSELAHAPRPLLVVRTLGADGLQARWQGEWTSFEPFVPPRVVDTAGAGDWCSVALLHVLAQKGSTAFASAQSTKIERALRLGQALAALSCGFEGARGLMSATGTVDRVNRMLRTMIGGDENLTDIAITSAPTKTVEICKVCSDAERMTLAKKPQSA